MKDLDIVDWKGDAKYLVKLPTTVLGRSLMC